MKWVNIRIGGVFCSRIDRFYRPVNEFHYTYHSIFSGSFLAVSQIRGVAPRIKLYHSDPSTDRSTRIVRHIEQNFDLHRMMFGDLKGKKQLTSQCFCKKMETPKF